MHLFSFCLTFLISQEQKSAKNICPAIAKTGKIDACHFGGSCKFSHDLDGFLQQVCSISFFFGKLGVDFTVFSC